MAKSKITVTLGAALLGRVDCLIADMPRMNRSRFISDAIEEKLERTAPHLADSDLVGPEQTKPEKEVLHPPDEWSEL